MNRRDFFGAVGAVGGALALGSKPEVRRVMFAPPGEPPFIYWMHGHVAIDEFVSMWSKAKRTDVAIEPAYVRHGWGTRKLTFISIYISDIPLENYEPITYWIPSDQQEATQ